MPSEPQNAIDARVEQLWRILDTRQEGQLDINGLRRGLKKMDHPLKNADLLLKDVMKAVDTNGDGRIQYNEFRVFVEETEKELRTLFNSIDHDHDGKLDKGELQAAFSRAGLAVPSSKLDRFFVEVDTDQDGVISFDEWRDFLLFIPVNTPGLRAVLSYYSSAVTLSPEGDVQVSDENVRGLVRQRPYMRSRETAGRLNNLHDRRRRPPLEVRPSAFPATVPAYTPTPGPPTAPTSQAVVPATRPVAPEAFHPHAPADESYLFVEPDDVGKPAVYWKPILTDLLPDPGYFLAGGIAGVISRTATAPLDRLKVYLIAQTGLGRDAVQAAKQGDAVAAAKKVSRPLIEASKELWRAGGVRSLFAGNGLNVVKVMPESAIKFGSYEGSKRALAKLEGHADPRQINPWSKFVAGGVGGMISQFFVYPIDTLKFRMQCETVEGGLHGNRLIFDTAWKMWKTNGLRTYYRGLPMGLVGMFPYAAIDLGTFEYLKRAIASKNARRRGCHEEDAAPGSFMTAGIGAFSGALGASIVYPLNLLRTRLQAQGTAIHPPTYAGIVDVTRKTVKHEGFRGLFKGITPNLLKVVPAVSITYVVYENSKRVLSLQ